MRGNFNPLNTDTHRQCCGCKVVKPLEDFHRNKKSHQGRTYYCRPCKSEYNVHRKPKRASSPDENFHYNLRKYGLTPLGYDALLESQGGACAICGSACPSGKRLAVDHCHNTGTVRGLLCARCNPGIGMFKDQPDLLLVAVEYLETSKRRQL